MNRRVQALVRKEFREIRRDPLTVWIVVMVPLVLLVLFGYAISLEIEDVPMAVVDLDRSPESRSFVDAFVNTGRFVVRHRGDRVADATRLMDVGSVRLVLIVPGGFARSLGAGDAASLQTLIDGSFSARATVIRNDVDAVTLAFSRALLRDVPTGTVVAGGPDVVPRVWYNPSLRSATFVIPGLFAVILMAFPPLLTVLAIVREKESGSIQQVYVSPLRRWEFLAGKMTPYVLIAFGELALVVSLGAWWFRVPFRGSVLLLAAASLLYVVGTVTLGLLVSTLTRSQVVAILLATIITVMPSFLFSGFIYSISSMPRLTQWRTYLFPGRYFTEISRGLFLKGTGLAELWAPIAALGLYTAVAFGVAMLRFRKKVA